MAVHIEAPGADPTDVLLVVGTTVQQQALTAQGYTETRSAQLELIESGEDISSKVWQNIFVSKLLTVSKFLGLK